MAAALAGTAFWAVARSRRRRAQWAAGLADARSEGQWILSELAPAASTQPTEQWRGSWSVARSRVLALDERLTGLVAAAPDETQAAAATGLMGAVRAIAAAMQRMADQPDDAARTALASAAQDLARSTQNPPGTAGPAT